MRNKTQSLRQHFLFKPLPPKLCHFAPPASLMTLFFDSASLNRVEVAQVLQLQRLLHIGLVLMAVWSAPETVLANADMKCSDENVLEFLKNMFESLTICQVGGIFYPLLYYGRILSGLRQLRSLRHRLEILGWGQTVGLICEQTLGIGRKPNVFCLFCIP